MFTAEFSWGQGEFGVFLHGIFCLRSVLRGCTRGHSGAPVDPEEWAQEPLGLRDGTAPALSDSLEEPQEDFGT